MKCKREDVLQHFLQSKLLLEKSTLSEDELQNVSFTDNSQDLLVESLKRLTFSYCQEDSDLKILQNVNKEIKQIIG